MGNLQDVDCRVLIRIRGRGESNSLDRLTRTSEQEAASGGQSEVMGHLLVLKKSPFNS